MNIYESKMYALVDKNQLSKGEIVVYPCEEDDDEVSQNICELHFETKNKVYRKLNENENWRIILNHLESVQNCCNVGLPNSRIYNSQTCSRAVERNTSNPGRSLYISLGNQGMTVNELIDLFEETDLIEAKMALVVYQPVFIKQEPADNIQVCVDEPIELSCRASGVPPPQYKWFKFDEELVNENRPELIIFSARIDSAGDYRCQVTNTDPQSGEHNVVFSSWCNVTVRRRQKAQSQCNKPVIEWEPVAPSGKVKIGSSIVLECIATCESGLHYQWYKNGNEMPGECSSTLNLKFIDPDKHGLCSRYLCKVTNDFGTSVYSREVVIELDVEDGTTQHYAKDKVALLIGNNNYDCEDKFDPLPLSKSDVKTLAELLKSMDFRVFAYVDLNLIEMYNAIQSFAQHLDEGVYGLFYFAGHGFEINGQNYLVPTDAISESPRQCISAQNCLLRQMQEKKPKLCAILLDTCRKTPEDINAHMETYPLQSCVTLRNTIFGYSTASLLGAHEVQDRENGVYMTYLKEHIKDKRSLWDVLFEVHKEAERDLLIADVQHPWTAGGLARNLTLLDPVIRENEPADETRKRNADMQLFSQTICITRLDVAVKITGKPGEGVFCNALEIIFEITKYSHALKFYTVLVIVNGGDHQLKVGEDLVIRKYNLQRLRDPIIVSLRFDPCISGQLCFQTNDIQIISPFIDEAKRLGLNRLEN